MSIVYMSIVGPNETNKKYLLLLSIKRVPMAANLYSFYFIELCAKDVKGDKYFHIYNNIDQIESNFKLSCSVVAGRAPYDAFTSHISVRF